MKRAFLAGLLLLVPLLLLGWLYEGLPEYRTWVVIGAIGGLLGVCPCVKKTEGGHTL